jgi:hypothetical protein
MPPGPGDGLLFRAAAIVWISAVLLFVEKGTNTIVVNRCPAHAAGVGAYQQPEGSGFISPDGERLTGIVKTLHLE